MGASAQAAVRRDARILRMRSASWRGELSWAHVMRMQTQPVSRRIRSSRLHGADRRP